MCWKKTHKTLHWVSFLLIIKELKKWYIRSHWDGFLFLLHCFIQWFNCPPWAGAPTCCQPISAQQCVSFSWLALLGDHCLDWLLLFILVYTNNLSRGSPGSIEQSCMLHLLSNMEMGLQRIYPACITELSLLWSSLSPLVTTHFKAHSLLGWPFLCMLSSSFALSFFF